MPRKTKEQKAEKTARRAIRRKDGPARTIDYSRLVVASVTRRSHYNVRRTPVIGVNRGLDNSLRRRTYYLADVAHVMPALHAEILAAAGLIVAGSVRAAPAKAKPTGIVRRPEDPRPRPEEFANNPTGPKHLSRSEFRNVLAGPVGDEFADPEFAELENEGEEEIEPVNPKPPAEPGDEDDEDFEDDGDLDPEEA